MEKETVMDQKEIHVNVNERFVKWNRASYLRTIIDQFALITGIGIDHWQQGALNAYLTLDLLSLSSDLSQYDHNARKINIYVQGYCSTTVPYLLRCCN